MGKREKERARDAVKAVEGKEKICERGILQPFKGIILSGILLFSREINYAPKRGMTFKVYLHLFGINS